jgi:hypothetical protein
MFATVTFANADSLRHMINMMNKKVSQTFRNRDMAGFEKITRNGVTSEFKYVENGKTTDYDGMLNMMKQSFGMLKSIDVARATTSNVVQHNGTATAKSRHHLVGTMMGPDSKVHKMIMDGTSNDTFRKEDGKWKLASMSWGKAKMMMDGKPFDPSKMMPPSAGGK